MHLTTQPLVSIVMCVYNGERFLKEQVESILNQSYQNFELICVDDQSTDRSVEMLDNFQKADSRIKVFQNKIRLGFNKNFERGISLSNGDLISICDQDDIWLPSKIEELVKHIGDHSLIYSNSELIDEQNNPLQRDLQLKYVHNPSYKAFLVNNFVTGHTCLFKRKLLDFIIPFPQDILYYDWWIGFAAAYVGGITYLDKALTKYRVHSQSVIKKDKEAAQAVKEPGQVSSSQKRIVQLKAFSEASFIREPDRKFIQRFIKRRQAASSGLLGYLNLYTFLLKNHTSIFPWYKKGYISKLNFLRKQTLY